jgi:DNA-binding response OmpR family regulator
MMDSPDRDLETERTVWLKFQNQRQAGIYRDYLEQDGYRVVTYQDVLDIPQQVNRACPDVIVLDCADQLSKLDGVLRPDEIAGMVLILLDPELPDQRLSPGEENGHFYLALNQKVGPRELSRQIRASLHRVGKSGPTACKYRKGDLYLDRDKHFVIAAGQYVDLTPTEFDLLSIFMAWPEKVFSRAALLDWLGGTNFSRRGRTIDVHIRNIRAKIEVVSPQNAVIQTVYRIGYRLSPRE